MTVEMFLMLLAAWTAITTLVTEAIKKLFTDENTTFVALIVALVVGTIGTAIYYYLTDIAFTGKNIVCMIIMAFAAGLAATTSFDKVAKIIEYFKK